MIDWYELEPRRHLIQYQCLNCNEIEFVQKTSYQIHGTCLSQSLFAKGSLQASAKCIMRGFAEFCEVLQELAKYHENLHVFFEDHWNMKEKYLFYTV